MVDPYRQIIELLNVRKVDVKFFAFLFDMIAVVINYVAAFILMRASKMRRTIECVFHFKIVIARQNLIGLLNKALLLDGHLHMQRL